MGACLLTRAERKDETQQIKEFTCVRVVVASSFCRHRDTQHIDI